MIKACNDPAKPCRGRHLFISRFYIWCLYAAVLKHTPPSILCAYNVEPFVNYVDMYCELLLQAVVQLARVQGVRTINVIRPRTDWEATVAKLKGLGADLVTTEAHLKQDLATSGLQAPRLALDCVGGSTAASVAKCLR